MLPTTYSITQTCQQLASLWQAQSAPTEATHSSVRMTVSMHQPWKSRVHRRLPTSSVTQSGTMTTSDKRAHTRQARCKELFLDARIVIDNSICCSDPMSLQIFQDLASTATTLSSIMKPNLLKVSEPGQVVVWVFHQENDLLESLSKNK